MIFNIKQSINLFDFFSFKMKFILRCLRHAAKGVIAADSEISFYDIENSNKDLQDFLLWQWDLNEK